MFAQVIARAALNRCMSRSSGKVKSLGADAAVKGLLSLNPETILLDTELLRMDWSAGKYSRQSLPVG